MLRYIKRKRRRAAAFTKRVADGWCASVGPNTGAFCQWRSGHAQNHRAEDALDPIIIEEWCDPRMGERYDDLADAR